IAHAQALAQAHQQLAGATAAQIEEGAKWIEQANTAKERTDAETEAMKALQKASEDTFAAREKFIRDTGIEADKVLAITALGQLDTKARAESIAVLERQAELKKDNKTLTDAEADAIRALADAEFDAAHKSQSFQEALQEAFGKFKETARDNAQAVQNGFDIAFNAMNSALDQFVETGKVKIADLVRTMLADFAKLGANWVFNQLLGMLTGGGGTGNATADAGLLGQVFGVATHAKGTVLHRPTIVGFARGRVD